ncbi:BrxA family protein [Candidatus Viadribacter manganicus]|uniref:DUF1819 domain-containing protein n=1 Tax=Candidatus Viadribacter manganicus TaxID=1759059 RepID=A0A1B1AHP5_9PROT|nr:BrxA family protein [Candidatus Viadribacter manganicus]ANP46084.1 hypothetical protein ATE48_09195 [Candidatus Viadribacter manganicus]
MIPAPEWSTRLVTVGMLVDESFRMARLWNDQKSFDDNFESSLAGQFRSMSLEGAVKATLRRRFRAIEAASPVLLLAKQGMPFHEWRDCLRLLIGATEQPFRSFVTEWLFGEYVRGRYQVRSIDLHPFLAALWKEMARTKEPTRYSFERTATGLIKGARDLGLLQGNKSNHAFAVTPLSDEVALFYVVFIAQVEGSFSKVSTSLLWRLAMLGPAEVHALLLRLHQYKRLTYDVAGSLVALESKHRSIESFAKGYRA